MIIKAQELRIGNWVLSPNDVEFKITSLDFDEFHSHPHEYYVNNFELNRINPIPITEEWLLRFGFSNENLLDEYYLEPYYFNIIDMTLDIGGIYVDLKYIHQIQNLIHAFTGKELELKK